jgi:hypothetical protein
LPTGISACTAVAPCDIAGPTATGKVDICSILVSDYLAALPVDPLTNNGTAVTSTGCASAYDTNYTIFQSTTNNRVTVSAPAAELPGTVISVTR